jgi:hypothetical protein
MISTLRLSAVECVFWVHLERRLVGKKLCSWRHLFMNNNFQKKEVETSEMLLADKVIRAMKGEDAFQVSKCKVGPLES